LRGWRRAPGEDQSQNEAPDAQARFCLDRHDASAFGVLEDSVDVDVDLDVTVLGGGIARLSLEERGRAGGRARGRHGLRCDDWALDG
jgi:hypothetical protein